MRNKNIFLLLMAAVMVLSGCMTRPSRRRSHDTIDTTLSSEEAEQQTTFATEGVEVDDTEPTETATVTENTEAIEPTEPEEVTVDSVTYRIVTDDRSYKNESGRVLIENSYQLVVLDGDSEAIAAINADLNSKMEGFFLTESELQSYLGDPYLTPEYPYSNACSVKVTHNSNGFIAVWYTTEWYMGGVYNSDNYGVVYNLNTGLPATLTELTGREALSLEKQLKQNAWEHIKSEYGDALFAEAHETLYKYDLEELKYCLEDGEIVLLFATYELGPGYMGSVRAHTDVYVIGS